LRAPIGKLFTGKPDITAKEAIKFIKSKQKGLVVAVGDICTKSLLDAGFYPNIIIFDEKTRREEKILLNLEFYTQKQAFNPQGWILQNTWDAIKNAIAFSTSNNCRIAVRIEGEEDLLIIPAIISLPLGSIVIYGQPKLVYGHPPITTKEGLVVVPITSSLKSKVDSILKKFEIHEEYLDGNYNNRGEI
jgi:uncharacterized protein (UPF0218 family)